MKYAKGTTKLPQLGSFQSMHERVVAYDHTQVADLICPAGTPIYAVVDVFCKFSKFYMGTFYLQINHGSFSVNYGEVQPDIHKIPATLDLFLLGNVLQKGLVQGLKNWFKC
jgi:hypothetical protein